MGGGVVVMFIKTFFCTISVSGDEHVKIVLSFVRGTKVQCTLMIVRQTRYLLKYANHRQYQFSQLKHYLILPCSHDKFGGGSPEWHAGRRRETIMLQVMSRLPSSTLVELNS